MRSRELGTAVLAGLVVGGVISAVLDLSIGDTLGPVAVAIGALVGGMVSAYVLYGNVGQAVTAGGLSGVLTTPFFLGVAQILFIFGLVPVPSGPAPSMAELQSAVVLVVGMNFVAGAAGGALLGGAHHPAKASPIREPGRPPAEVRYCVQCGARLSAENLICPHCNARQPQA